MDPRRALDLLKQWCDIDRMEDARKAGVDASQLPPLTFHWTLIQGANDDTKTIDDITLALKERRFANARFHLVAYNPPPLPKSTVTCHRTRDAVRVAALSSEASPKQLDYAFTALSSCFPDPSLSKRIARVGFDVHASCGTFFDAN